MNVVKARKVNEIFNYLMTHHLFNDDELVKIGRVLADVIDRTLEDEK